MTHAPASDAPPASDRQNDGQTITMSAEEARRTWRTLLDVVITGEDVVVERYARPTVAVIPYEDYAAIRHELAEMRAMRRTNQVRAAWQQGKIKALPWETTPEDQTAEHTGATAAK